MKNLVYYLFALIAMFVVSSCSTDETSSLIETSASEYQYTTYGWPSSGSVAVSWSIGRKSRNCQGIGICKREKTIVKLEDLTIDVEELIKTFSFYSNVIVKDENNLLLEVDPISAECIEALYGKSSIILEEDFVFEKDGFEELGLNEDFIMPTGEYELTFNNSTGFYDVLISR